MKKIKFVIPSFAFLFAIVASFATVNAKETLLDPRVSLPAPGACEDIGKCTAGPQTCKTGLTIYREFFTASGTCGSSVNGNYEED